MYGHSLLESVITWQIQASATLERRPSKQDKVYSSGAPANAGRYDCFREGRVYTFATQLPRLETSTVCCVIPPLALYITLMDCHIRFMAIMCAASAKQLVCYSSVSNVALAVSQRCIGYDCHCESIVLLWLYLRHYDTCLSRSQMHTNTISSTVSQAYRSNRLDQVALPERRRSSSRSLPAYFTCLRDNPTQSTQQASASNVAEASLEADPESQPRLDVQSVYGRVLQYVNSPPLRAMTSLTFTQNPAATAKRNL